MKRICVFCGANAGASPIYVENARAVGARLAQAGISLVYGGGGLGLMGAVAKGALDAGGEAIGVIPESLLRFERPPGFLTELRVVRSMHERKALMVELSDAFLALPGGLGTLDEVSEVLTWAQLGLHSALQALRPAQCRGILRLAHGMVGSCDRAALYSG